MKNKTAWQFSLLLFAFISFKVSAQNSKTTALEHNKSVQNQENYEIDYNKLALDTKQLLVANDKFEVYYAKTIYKNDTVGINHERIAFYFVNKTSNELKLSFQKVLKYKDRPVSASTDLTTITLLPNEEKGMPQAPLNSNYYIFVKDLKGTIKAQLEKIAIKNVTLL